MSAQSGSQGRRITEIEPDRGPDREGNGSLVYGRARTAPAVPKDDARSKLLSKGMEVRPCTLRTLADGGACPLINPYVCEKTSCKSAAALKTAPISAKVALGPVAAASAAIPPVGRLWKPTLSAPVALG
jgi:hypothetical protein